MQCSEMLICQTLVARLDLPHIKYGLLNACKDLKEFLPSHSRLSIATADLGDKYLLGYSDLKTSTPHDIMLLLSSSFVWLVAPSEPLATNHTRPAVARRFTVRRKSRRFWKFVPTPSPAQELQ